MNDCKCFPQTITPAGFDPKDVAPPPIINRHRDIMSLALDISGSCNLACRYCAEAATQPRRSGMTPETLEAAWRFLFPDGRFRPGVSLRFGSGEPLLAIGILKRVAELIGSTNCSHQAEMPEVFLTTNGTLINRKVSEWLISTGWHIKISLDGPEFIHDAWRVRPGGQGTFAHVATVVAELAQKIPDRFSVTAVLCHGTDPQKAFDGIASLGVNRIELVPVAHHDQSVRLHPEDIVHYQNFINNYAHRYLDSKEDKRPPTLVRFAGSVARVMGYDVRRIPCGAGRSFLGAGPGGNLYPCFRFIGVEKYQIGNLASGLKPDAAKAFANGPGRSYDKRFPCMDCWAAPLCGGPCFACAEMFGPGGGHPITSHCAYILADARSSVWLVNQLKKRDPLRLLAFLPNSIEVS